MVLRFCLGVGDAGERREEHVGGVHMHERDVVMAAKELDDLLRLALAHEAMVDEDAGEPVADRLMDEHRGDRRIDPAREAADAPFRRRPAPGSCAIASSR